MKNPYIRTTNTNNKCGTYAIILVIAFYCFTIYSCSNNTTVKEDFYSTSKTFDLYRLPLIEPYQLISADKGHSWHFKLPYKQTDVIDNSVSVEKTGLSNNVILLYSPLIYVNNEMTEAWFVIDTKNKYEKVFADETGYIAYLRKIGLENTKLYDVREIYKRFETTGILPEEWPKYK